MKAVRMPSDPKLRGTKRKKRKFAGNQHTKKQNKSSESTSSGIQPMVLNENAETVDIVPDAEDTILQSATPTCSERKLLNLYKLPSSDSSESEEHRD